MPLLTQTSSGTDEPAVAVRGVGDGSGRRWMAEVATVCDGGGGGGGAGSRQNMDVSTCPVAYFLARRAGNHKTQTARVIVYV